ncbi:MAG: hypothetical protein K2M69_07255 [Muribaculaceae bacterium]|nr:hypothetical protein [Muribaculaceae bacterium]
MKKSLLIATIAALTTMAAQTVIYTMQGMRLTTAPSSLPAGVYIINGKKVMVK